MPSWAELLAKDKKKASRSGKKELQESSCLHPNFEDLKNNELSMVGLRKSGILSLVPGCIQYISNFLSYGDVLQLRSACKQLNNFITADDVLWDTQLAVFRAEMGNLYGATLLRTDFAFSAKTGFERFMVERRLYHFDSMRTWNLQEHTSLRDESTGIFTVPLYQKGAEHLSRSEWNLSEKQEIGAPLPLEKVEKLVIPIHFYSIKTEDHQDAKPLDMNDEEAVLKYVLAQSVAESGRNNYHPFEYASEKFSRRILSPSQILSSLDRFSTLLSENEGQLHIEDTTEVENPEFISALSLTLSAVKRRRLLIDKRQYRQSNGQSVYRSFFQGLPCEVEDVPQENKILSSFTGKLLEISRKEMLSLCRTLLQKESIASIETFMGYEASHSIGIRPKSGSHGVPFSNGTIPVGRIYPVEWCRCFLLPEVCQEHAVALLIVDPIRAFFLIEDDREARHTSPNTMLQDMQRR